MKMLATLFFIAICVVAAPAQVLLDSTVVSLTTTGTTTITSTSSGAGTLNSVGCWVYDGTNDSASAVLKVSLDGGVHTQSYTVFTTGYVPNSILPFTLAPYAPFGSSAYVESFMLPMNVAYTSSGLRVPLDVTSAGSFSGGSFTCSVLHT